MKTQFYMSKTDFARKCDFTGDGMNYGWFIVEGHLYAKYESDVINYIQKIGYTSLKDAYKGGAINYLEFHKDEFYSIEGNI